MRRIKQIFLLALAALALIAGWQFGSAEFDNYQLQQDLRQLASNQTSFRFGNVARTDDDVREAVIRKAMDDGVDLQPDQVTVRHSDDAQLYLAAQYSVPVRVADYSFVLHFTPTSASN